MQPHRDSVLVYFQQLRDHDPTALQVFVCGSDEEFDVLVERALAAALNELEQNSSEYTSLSENGYTAVLVASLNGRPFLHATRETHSNGHVDITIVANGGGPPRTRLGEAKVHDGPKRHVDGVGQLVGRYATGREEFGFIVSYVRNPGIKTLIAAVRAYMDERLPLRQVGACGDHPMRWAFTSRHTHRSEETLRVLHLGCNVHAPGKASSAPSA